MIRENNQPIELPDRKEITLCEAVTAFVYGRACDVKAFQAMHLNTGVGKELTAVFGKELTRKQKAEEKKQKAEQKVQTAKQKGQIAKVEDLLERLHSAAYAGSVKFRAVKEGEDGSGGFRSIDPLYFYVKPFFNWPQDAIVRLEDESSTPWYFVHLDREDFVSLLGDMGFSIQPNPNTDTGGAVRESIFRPGAPGRPGSIHLVLPEARRRIEQQDLPETLKVFSGQLAAWLKANYPLAHPLTPRTIENSVRPMWPGYAKRTK
jgi:hypothetical protein